jgi:hypothetical protein
MLDVKRVRSFLLPHANGKEAASQLGRAGREPDTQHGEEMNTLPVPLSNNAIIDLTCPQCASTVKNLPVPANQSLMVCCERCSQRWEIDTSPRGIRLLRIKRNTAYQPAASHDDASRFRRRMAKYAKMRRA